jgi:rhodanese-related sulfurtransferase
MKLAVKFARPRTRPEAPVFTLPLTAFVFLFLAAVGAPLRGQERGPAERGGQASGHFDPGDFSEYGDELSEYIAMPETLMYKMRAGEKGFVVVDLREPERFAGGHLRGAVNYPWKGGVFLSICKNLPRDREVFLMSEDGGFGLEALRVLVDAGFTGAYSVEGGMRNWPYTDLLEGH